jgi:hypothetical protein
MSSKIPCTKLIGDRSSFVRTSRPAKLFALFSLLCFFGIADRQSSAQAYSFPGETPVKTTSAPVAINVAIQQSGQISAIHVVGQGNANVDFVNANSGTCTVGVSYPAGQACTVGVSFAPLYPGVRSGAVVLTAQDGTVLGRQFISGVGVGGIGTFVPGMISTVAGHATWLYNGDGEAAVNASIFLPLGSLSIRSATYTSRTRATIVSARSRPRQA